MSQAAAQSIPSGQSGASFRAKANDIFAALYTLNAGATAPSPTSQGMPWLDTGVSPAVLRVRNAANTAWIAVSPETLTAKTLWGNSGAGAAAPGEISMATLKTMLGFAQTLGASGYQTLPSGLIVQWVLSPSIASGANAAVALPVTFPTACRAVLASYSNTGADAAVGSAYIGQVRAISASSVTLRNLGPAGAVFFVFAIGD